MKRIQRTALDVERLESRRLLAVDSLLISEFMAANDSVVRDDDGDFSDWIELYNPTGQAISLQGWSLTDDAERLDKWGLLDGSLGAHEYLMVFASGKDRRQPDAALHTNFRLDKQGEFLGLVDPSGTVVQSFGDAYPPQRDDVAYGLPIDQQLLIAPDGPGRWWVPGPPDATLGQGWAGLQYDDASWFSSTGALGYDRRPGLPNVGFEAADLSDWSTSGDVRATTASAGAVPTQGSWQASLLATESGVARFSLETFLGLSRSALNRAGTVEVTRGSALKRTFTVEAGSQLQVDWNFLTNEPLVNGAQDFAFLSISPGDQVVVLAGVADATRPSGTALDRETGYQTYQHTFNQAGQYTIGLGVVNEATRFLNSGLLVDNLRIDGVGSLEETFNAIINTPVDIPLATAASSLWLRQAFQLADVSQAESLQLRARYDDGLVVYVNGEPLARDNAPAATAWNALAMDDRDDTGALDYQVFTLPASVLQPGDNLLAVQTLKSAVDDENLLLQTELVALGAIDEVPVFLSTPTPGRANVSDAFGVVESVQFSEPHGFYERAFGLVLSTPTVGASIRYTLDGSTPTTSNSTLYEGSIRIDQTQTVRAAAFREGMRPSAVATQSYLFIADVLAQDRAAALARGFPNTWSEFTVADYDMDRRVIGQNGTDLFGGVYADTVRDDLKAVPTLSLVMNFEDLFGTRGIYSNPFERGVEWERPTSLELIYPDGREGFQINAGIRIQGGISRFIASKMSLRLLFKDDYGASKLEYPLFGPDAGSTFDSISLRSSSGEHLVGIHYIRDEFVRRSQLMTGNVAAHGNYMHLFINGLYWGLYNPTERIDGQFAANYYGGDKTEYDVLNAGDLGNEGISAVAGSLDAWNRLVELAGDVSAARSQEDKTAAYLRLQGLNPDGTRNPDWESYLDTENFIDYLVTQVYVRNIDWPIRNYYMVRRRGSDSTGFKFYVWDAEFTLDRGTRDSISSITRDGPGIVYQLLDTSEAFRVDFSDRVQQLFAPGGAYYVNPTNRAWDPQHPEDNVPASLYASLADEVFSPLGPEMARWGDEQARNGRLFVRDAEWAQTVQFNLTQFFPNRSRDFLADLRRNEFYRDAPRLVPAGGLIQPGQTIEIQPVTGQAYYTLDGSDPRRPDGTLSDAAMLYTDPITLDARTRLHVRSLNGSEWSAVNSATYYTDSLPATPESLRIAEVNYNPHAPLTRLGEADLDSNEFEFIEIVNVSPAAVDLTGVQLAEVDGQGVSFTFGQQRLDAGQRTVVPRNREAFLSRYGTLAVLAQGVDPLTSQWVYQGRLGNGGETLTLLTADGQLIQRFTYDDQEGWPARADGGGSSLELIDLAGDLADPANYRDSIQVGGSPGSEGATSVPAIVINEVLASPGQGGVDQVEIYNTSDGPVDVSGWYLSDSNNDLTLGSLPLQTLLARGGYLTLDERQLGFGLSGSRGDELFLVSADAQGRLGAFVDEVHFDASDSGVSLGRWPNGQGALFPQAIASLGGANTGPLFGPAILSEVHYHPRDPDGVGPLTGKDFEYVEVYNRSGQSLDLTGWRIAGDTEYVFPAATVLGADQALVVVPFDPLSNPTLVSAFGLTFSVGAGVKLVGPAQGSLADAGGTLRLERPVAAAPGDDPPAWVLVDRVSYDSQPPWPDDLQATGRSLQRVGEMLFGDFATSWVGARAAPGSVNFVGGVPGDVTGDGRVDLADVDRLCAAVRAQEVADVLDVNRDGQVNHDDFDALIAEVLQTHAGDANLDGVFNSSDLVSVFAAAEYEDATPGNSTWAEGDWNCDGDFTSRDIVAAFVAGGYSASGRTANANQPAAAASVAAPVAAAPVDPRAASVVAETWGSPRDRHPRGVLDEAAGSAGMLGLPWREPALETSSPRLRLPHRIPPWQTLDPLWADATEPDAKPSSDPVLAIWADRLFAELSSGPDLRRPGEAPAS